MQEPGPPSRRSSASGQLAGTSTDACGMRHAIEVEPVTLPGCAQRAGSEDSKGWISGHSAPAQYPCAMADPARCTSVSANEGHARLCIEIGGRALTTAVDQGISLVEPAVSFLGAEKRLRFAPKAWLHTPSLEHLAAL